MDDWPSVLTFALVLLLLVLTAGLMARRAHADYEIVSTDPRGTVTVEPQKLPTLEACRIELLKLAKEGKVPLDSHCLQTDSHVAPHKS